MSTLVIGANGQIGRQFCELAQEAGEPIVAMVRDEQQQAWFEQRGIRSVRGDLEGDFEQAFEGCDQVVFTAGSGPHTGPDKTLLIDLYGAIRVTDAARRHGLERMLLVSALRAESPLDAPEKLRPYMAAKFAADAYLQSSGLGYVILKPGRLTDEPASGKVATSLDESADDNRVSRANVAHALLHLVQQRSLRQHQFALLDGHQVIADALSESNE